MNTKRRIIIYEDDENFNYTWFEYSFTKSVVSDPSLGELMHVLLWLKLYEIL